MNRSSMLRLAMALLVAGAVVAALIIIIARGLAPQGPRGAEPIDAMAQEAAVVMGTGQAGEDGLEITRLSDEGEAFVVWPMTPFAALERPVLRYEIDDLPLNHVLMLAWRRDDSEEVFFSGLQPATGRVQFDLLSRFEGWQGTIVEVALYVYPHPQTAAPEPVPDPIHVREVSLHPDHLGGRLRTLTTAWLGVDPWNMMAISSLGIYRDIDEPPRLLPVAAVAALLVWLAIGLALRPSGLRGWVRLALAVVLATTVLLQLLTLRSLALQREATEQVFGELPVEAWPTKTFDAPLAAFIERVKARLPDADGRIMTASDDRFFRLRMAWYLRPANVLSGLPGENLRGAEAVPLLRQGDHIVVWRRPGLMQEAREGSIAIRGHQVPVRVLLAEGDDGLLLIDGEVRR